MLLNYRFSAIYAIFLFFIVSTQAQDVKYPSLDDHFTDYNVIPFNTSEIMKDLSNVQFGYKTKFLGWDITLDDSGIIGDKYQCVTYDGQKTTIQPKTTARAMSGYTSQGGRVSLTFNDNFIQGFIQAGMFTFYIEPLTNFDKNATEGHFVLYNVKDIKPGQEKVCGVTDVHKAKDNTASQANEGSRAGGCFSVKYAIAADYSMFTGYMSSVTAVQNHNIAVTNDMQTNYDDEFADVVQFEIVEQYIVTTSTGDQWGSDLSSSTLLTNFRLWAQSGFTATHDIGSLWSKRDFDGPSVNTVGLAYVGVLCSGFQYNVLMDFSSDAPSKRVLLAHELGHNFNASHDAAGMTIMAPSVQNTNTWSTTSITSIQDHYSSSSCLAVCNTGPPQISFKLASTNVTDYSGAGSTSTCNQPFKTIFIPVEVNKATSNAISVSVNLVAGNTATANRDFILVNNVLTFPAGVKTTQNIEVRVIDDAIEEPTENVSLQLNISSGNAVLGSATMHTISISDLDGASATCCSPTETIYGNPNGQYNIIFNGFFEDARSRVLYLPFQLTTAGIQPGYISAIQYFVTLKQSTQPYQNFKVRLANVSQNNLSNMEWISTEEVFHGNISTQNNSWNSIIFDKPFYWNGTSSLYIEFCFDNTSWTQDDYISWTSPQGGGTGTFVQVLYRDEISDCNLTPQNSNVLSLGNIQPHLRFTQINTIKVETIINSISKSELKVNEKANFYSQSGKIIASVKNLGNIDIGCIEATIETTGSGKLALPTGGGDYTAKTFKITASPNALYEVTLYYTQAELNIFGANANKLNIIKTQSTLATSNAGNSTLTAPDVIVTGLGADLAYAYSGVFTGFSRFALTDRKVDNGSSINNGDLVIAEQGKGIILSNKGGTSYQISVNNSGSIITQVVTSPTPKARMNISNLIMNTAGKKLILRSPDGNYRVINISDTGALSTATTTLPSVRAQLTTGDIELENDGSALIVKSPNGQCWRLFVNETGVLQTVNILCP
jgi:hypothetical protein